MKPFSSLKFFVENKKRAATIIIILFLSVAVVSFITSIVTTIIQDATKANLNSYKAVSVISAVSNDVFLDEDIIEEVSNIPEIEHIYNINMAYTYIKTIMGTTSSIVFFPDESEDIQIMMDKMGLKLKSGEMPNKYNWEIIMHEDLLHNKGLSIGDYIGSDVTDSEWLPGRYKIVGVMKGEPIISFGSKSSRKERFVNSGIAMDRAQAQLLIPKEGQLGQMNQKIEELDRFKVDYSTYTTLKKSFDEQTQSINILLTIIVIVVVFIVSLSISALIYIVYMDRSDEFGILHAIGYRKSFIKRLIFKELVALSVVSWVGGYIFSWIVLTIVNRFILYPIGQKLYFFTSLGLVNTLIIPFMVIACATYPILRKLKKWDPISVIERRD